MTYIEPAQAAAQIRKCLRARSGKSWSVILGRGSSWGWITITALPKRRDRSGCLTAADARELAALLALGHVHPQGVLIPDGSTARAEYLARAAGEHPTQQALAR